MDRFCHSQDSRVSRDISYLVSREGKSICGAKQDRENRVKLVKPVCSETIA
jgi:hypothetical protein